MLITHWEMNDLLIQSQHLEQLIEKYSQQTKMLLQIIFFLVCYLLTLHNSTECERFLIRFLKTQTIFLLMLPFFLFILKENELLLRETAFQPSLVCQFPGIPPVLR